MFCEANIDLRVNRYAFEVLVAILTGNPRANKGLSRNKKPHCAVQCGLYSVSLPLAMRHVGQGLTRRSSQCTSVEVTRAPEPQCTLTARCQRMLRFRRSKGPSQSQCY